MTKKEYSAARKRKKIAPGRNTAGSKSMMRYSGREQKFLALLPKDGSKISSTRIGDLFYGRATRPFHSRVIIIGVMRSLMRKVRHNREPFRVVKGPQSGPRPIEFWIERAGKKPTTAASGQEARA